MYLLDVRTYNNASLTWNETGNLASIQTGTNPYMASGANHSAANQSAANQNAADQTIAYTYLSDGTRRTKTVNGRTTTYHYNNGLLLSETTVNADTANGNGSTNSNAGSNANSPEAETLSYYYGSTGKLASVTYRKGNNTPVSYFYAYNGQGDVIALYRGSDSVLIGTYEYDLWGRPVSVKEATAGLDVNGILTKNPFRYRGYYYDEETGFYYLNARYYDPQVRRFISADEFISTEQGLIGYNMFAYCLDNPINRVDETGNKSIKIDVSLNMLKTVVFGDGNHQSYSKDSKLAKTLKKSLVMQDEIDKNIEAYNLSQGQENNFSGGVVLYGKENKYDFDLSYSVGKADYTMTISQETKQSGFWIFKKEKKRMVIDITVSDTYDFTEYRKGASIGNWMNNKGYSLQKNGKIKPYSWDVSYTVYGEWE